MLDLTAIRRGRYNSIIQSLIHQVENEKALMFKKLRTIQGKQLALAILVSVMPLLVVGAVVIYVTVVHINATVHEQLHQIIKDKTYSIRQWYQERRSDIQILATTNYIKSLLLEDDEPDTGEAELTLFFSAFLRQYGVYSQIALFDSDGEAVFAYPSLGTEFVEPPPYREDSSHDISAPFIWGYEAHVYISAPVRDRSLLIIGRLVALTRLESLNAITDNIEVGRTGEAYLVNREGYFVTHPRRSEVLSENVNQIEPIARLLRGDSFVGAFTDYRGTRVLGAYYWIPELRWGFVVEQSAAEAFAPAVNLATYLAVIVIITSLVVLFVAYSLTARTLRPLKILQQTIERIRNGNPDVRFPVETRDEIGETGDVFNRMLEQLQSAQEKLKERVEAADKELVNAHVELLNRHRELTKTQQQLLYSERISAMGEIAAGLAHEINNPLATIRMLINSLGSEDGEDLQERNQALAIIAEEIDKIAAMIGRFMDLTEPQHMRWEPLVIEKVIDRTLALVGPQLEMAGIKVTIDVPREIPTAQGDEQQLGQLLLNLLLNSMKAMPDGGRISICARAYSDNDDPGRYLLVEVSDTGTGIPEEIRKDIFKPFFTTRATGTGLGLSIVARIAENHRGRISVSTEEGKGTTFQLLLPESGARNA